MGEAISIVDRLKEKREKELGSPNNFPDFEGLVLSANKEKVPHICVFIHIDYIPSDFKLSEEDKAMELTLISKEYFLNILEQTVKSVKIPLDVNPKIPLDVNPDKILGRYIKGDKKYDERGLHYFLESLDFNCMSEDVTTLAELTGHELSTGSRKFENFFPFDHYKRNQ